MTEYHVSGKDPVSFLKEQSNKMGASTLHYMDAYAGRKCLDWFNKAGLLALRIDIMGRIQYQNHRESPPSPFDLLVVDEPVKDSRKSEAELIKSILSSLIANALLENRRLNLPQTRFVLGTRIPQRFASFRNSS